MMKYNVFIISLVVSLLFGSTGISAKTSKAKNKPEQDLYYVDKRTASLDKYVLGLKIDSRNTADYEKIVAQITKKSKTPYEKSRAIFMWLANNISYDTSYKINDPDETFRKRKGVCAGYAGLYEKFAKMAGLEVVLIAGIAKNNATYQPGQTTYQYNPELHGWNAVKIDGRWILIDATWGAGAVRGSTFTKKLNPSWFDTNPSVFALSHFPDENKWQLIKNPLSEEEFEVFPPLYPAITLMGLKGETILNHLRNDPTHSFPYMYFFDKKIQINKLPLSGELSSGSKYTFTFVLPDGYKVAVVQNENDWKDFSVQNNVWTLIYQPVAGNIRIMIDDDGDNKYQGLFVYEVR